METLELINTTNQINGELLNPSKFNFIFWGIIIFNLLCLAMAQTIKHRYIKTLFLTALYNRYLIQNSQEDMNLFGLSSFLLTLVYTNSLALIILMIVDFPFNFWTPLISFGILIFLALKLLLMRSVSFISLKREGINEHVLNHLVFYQITGIILTPILIFVTALPDSSHFLITVSSLIAVALIVIIREMQSFVHAIKYRISLFYIILYLCTLELLPLVLTLLSIANNLEVLN